ncbi:MAG: RIP metalloprotease RseP [Verrucomicrobiota bacterium]
MFVAIFALGFSIFIHELGHFVAAKKRGLIADRFSIGFGPRLFGWSRNGTDFRISLFPLGGYVSLPQLADMGQLEGGEEDESEKLPPITYTDKMIVAVMGAVFNLIFAVFLSLILWGVGREVVKSTQIGDVADEIYNSDGAIVPGPAYAAGIRPGDTLITIDDKKIDSWWQYQNALSTSVGRSSDGRPMVDVGVLRDGEVLSFTTYPEIVTSEDMRYLGLAPESDESSAPIVVTLDETMPAYQAGMQIGDRLIKLDDEAVISGAFLASYLATHGNREIAVTVERRNSEVVLQIKPRIKTEAGETSPRFGFGYDFKYKTEIVHYTPVEQLYNFADTMRMTLYALLHRGSDVKVRNMSGPVGIVHGLNRMARNGWIDLAWFLALINVNLAIFNLLPIPVLDGGHMTFATISKLIGRPLPRKFMERLQGAFVLILLSFMAYVSFFDVGRVGRDIGIINDEPPRAEPAAPEEEEAPAVESTEVSE